MIKSKSGFGSVTLYISLALIGSIIVGFFWIKALYTDIKYWKVEFNKANDALTLAKASVTDLEDKIALAEQATQHVREEYQSLMEDLMDLNTECKIVQCTSCPPDFVFISDPTKDKYLSRLYNLGREVP